MNRVCKKIICLLLFCMIFNFFSLPAYAEEESYSADNGIVEIYSGISDTNDNFYKIKNCSGFIVSNSDTGCYIVTMTKGITISSKERKSCISKNNLSTDTYGYNDTVKVVVNGDVSTSLTVIAKSKKENFAILQSENVINEKEELRLGNGTEEGETVYSLGFVNSSESTYTQYDKDDVVRCNGIVKNPSTAMSNSTYIQHTAYFEDGCSGGPLVNEDGYVVGLDDSSLSSDDYYSLKIESIKKILDNYSIPYSSYDYDQAYAKYTKLYSKCESLIQSGNYTAVSVEALNKVLEEIQTVMNDNPSTEDINSAISTLSDAKSQLVEKTPTLRIVIFVFLGVLSVLIMWLVYLLIVNWKHTHPKQVKEKDNKNEINNKEEYKVDYISVVSVPRTQKIAFLKKPNSQLLVKIDKKEFVLGSKIDEVDFVVNNKAVSRKHATIKLVDNKFCIFDENSVNGTYVNDVMIEDEGKILKTGDVIALANEQLIFEEKSIVGGGM